MEQEEFTGEKLKELRKKHNLTQKELAEKIDVAQTKISEWENEKHKISKAYQKLLLLFFNVNEKNI